MIKGCEKAAVLREFRIRDPSPQAESEDGTAERAFHFGATGDGPRLPR